MHTCFKFLLIFSIFLFMLGCTTHSEAEYGQLRQENTRLLLQLDSLTLHLDSVTNQYATPASGGREDLLSESDIDFLKRNGLTNPVEAIKTDLINNRQLISAKGTLGGSMHFYKDGIRVLTRQWVLAYFEDGHTAGEMLLEYKVSSKGTVSWKVLREHML